MLLFSFLLPERKPPRLFRFPLLTTLGLSRQLALLSLQLRRSICVAFLSCVVVYFLVS